MNEAGSSLASRPGVSSSALARSKDLHRLRPLAFLDERRALEERRARLRSLLVTGRGRVRREHRHRDDERDEQRNARSREPTAERAQATLLAEHVDVSLVRVLSARAD